MATKSKAKRKASVRKVEDLAARKDPRGGAQKKEGAGSAGDTLAGKPFKAGRTRLS